MHPLRTFDDVLKAFGGAQALGRITNHRASAICNWRSKQGRFPSKYYRSMRDELARRGYHAPHELWGQVDLEFPALEQHAA